MCEITYQANRNIFIRLLTIIGWSVVFSVRFFVEFLSAGVDFCLVNHKYPRHNYNPSSIFLEIRCTAG